jgi:hypothetical protein
MHDAQFGDQLDPLRMSAAKASGRRSRVRESASLEVV